jgi:hypothetical protein
MVISHAYIAYRRNVSSSAAEQAISSRSRLECRKRARDP